MLPHRMDLSSLSPRMASRSRMTIQCHPLDLRRLLSRGWPLAPTPAKYPRCTLCHDHRFPATTLQSHPERSMAAKAPTPRMCSLCQSLRRRRFHTHSDSAWTCPPSQTSDNGIQKQRCTAKERSPSGWHRCHLALGVCEPGDGHFAPGSPRLSPRIREGSRINAFSHATMPP